MNFNRHIQKFLVLIYHENECNNLKEKSGGKNMQVKNILFCPFTTIRSLPEDLFINNEIRFNSISFTEREYQLMIFLCKQMHGDGYNVRIYKNTSAIKHIPHHKDSAIWYDENDEYSTIFFETFFMAKEFLLNLAYHHKEYHIRPYRKIKVN